MVIGYIQGSTALYIRDYQTTAISLPLLYNLRVFNLRMSAERSHVDPVVRFLAVIKRPCLGGRLLQVRLHTISYST